MVFASCIESKADYSMMCVSLLVRETMLLGYTRIPPIVRRKERRLKSQTKRIATCRAPSPLLREPEPSATPRLDLDGVDDAERDQEDVRYAASMRASIRELRESLAKLKNRVNSHKKPKDQTPRRDLQRAPGNAPSTPRLSAEEKRNSWMPSQQKKQVTRHMRTRCRSSLCVHILRTEL
ncbi:hypothetical protein CAPTEDRAFT_188051 [Capitella teleta]|uniref:Uncharacterized protein n=1 Tax=Capitella teleta TaxID=283909 RepID=R7UW16_CAPTE|nr:hypothetical protein CAPTEDRAFT_188051 [Capitella teleta]|eukprot:ELU07546.1 hypothetical protein CAPTEDRAFT_188051 [Capitella teleta]